jgi:cytochrome b involved in lipid metabolism
VARRDGTKAELGGHASEASCWVAVYGEVYDFTDFLDEHPAGAEAILKYGGTDGTAIFDSVHSKDMLDDFDAIGPLVD